jgi:hypothetical protein
MKEEYQHFCIDWTVFTGDVVAQRTIYAYDQEGNLNIKEVDGSGECEVTDGVVDERDEYTYDGSGKLLIQAWHKYESGDAGRIVHTYDERGNRLNTEYYRGSDQSLDYTLYSKHASSYDSHGNILTDTNIDYGPLGAAYTFIYTYDSDCNLLSLSHVGTGEDSDRIIRPHTSYTYDCWK